MLGIKDLLVPATATIRDAVQTINDNTLGTAFVVNDKGRLLGMLTDGDLRRGLLQGKTLEDLVTSIMTQDFVSLPIGSSAETIFEHLSRQIQIIPLVDADGIPVDYAEVRSRHRIPAAEPALDGNEIDYVTQCLETSWISSAGEFIGRFENEFRDYVGAPHAVVVNSGTAALHLALKSLGVSPGDEVIVPDLTFAATAAAVVHAGATPVLVDVSRDSWCIDPNEIENAVTDRTRAIMPVHLYGQPADMDAISTIAEKHGLLVIEDAAESLGALHQGRHTGTIGDAGAYSFFGNKIITTGEGGMITFKDGAAAERARILRSHAQSPVRRYWHEEVGYNYRMTNIQAAIGVAQLERIDELIDRKLEIARLYCDGFKDTPWLTLPAVLDGRRNINWAFSVILDPPRADMDRQWLMDDLAKNGIETRPLFYPLHTMEPYRRFAGNRRFDNAEYLSQGGVSLPSSPKLTPPDIERIVSTVHRLFDLRSLHQATL